MLRFATMEGNPTVADDNLKGPDPLRDALGRILQGRTAPVMIVPADTLYKAVGLFFLLAFLFRYFPQISRVLLLVYAAAILAVLLNAIVQRLPGNRKWITAGIGLLIFGGIAALLWFGIPALITQVRDLAVRAPQFAAQLRGAEAWIQQTTGLNIHLVGEEAERFFRDAFLTTRGTDLMGRARGVLEVLLIPLVVLFGGLFAVGKPNERLLSPVLRAVPRRLRPAFRRMFRLLGDRIIGWLQGTLIGMLAVGLLSFGLFSLIGVPNALLLGVISGLTEFIPFFGPWIGGLVAVTVAFMDEPSKALWAALAAFAIQQFENSLIIPWAMSKAADLHPFVTLFAIVVFGSLFGILGVFLSIPLVLLFWTVIEVLWVERAIDSDEDRIAPVVRE